MYSNQNNQVTMEQAIALMTARTELEVDGVLALDTVLKLIASGIDPESDLYALPTFLGDN